MFDELAKYNQSNHFLFTPSDNLRCVCNAPTDKSGVYMIYALKDGHRELVYIGRSGLVRSDGRLFVRRAGLGGIKDRLVNGQQFGAPRRISWGIKMLEEKIEELDVYWYVTHNNEFVDCPRVLEQQLLQKYLSIYGRRSRWNLI